jgi:hypothetical protein
VSELSNNHFSNPNLKHVIAPEAPITTGGTPPSPEGPRNPNKKRRGLIAGTIGGLAAVAIAVPTFLAIENGNNTKPAPRGTETSAPVTPGGAETQAPTTGVEAPVLTGEALTQAFTIPENLTGDDLAKTFVQKIQNWGQYGQNLATQDGGIPLIQSQSKTGGETISQALIASGNIGSPLMGKFEQDMIAENISITDAWSKTFNKDKSSNQYPYVDIEAFNQTLEFNSATVVNTDTATGEVTMDINFTQKTDLKNRVDPTQESTINPNDAGFARNNVNTVWRVIFVHENGATKAKSVIIQPQE